MYFKYIDDIHFEQEEEKQIYHRQEITFDRCLETNQASYDELLFLNLKKFKLK